MPDAAGARAGVPLTAAARRRCAFSSACRSRGRSGGLIRRIPVKELHDERNFQRATPVRGIEVLRGLAARKAAAARPDRS